MSSRIRTKSGGACSIGTEKGSLGLARQETAMGNGVENGGRKPQRRKFSPAVMVAQSPKTPKAGSLVFYKGQRDLYRDSGET